VLQVVYAAQVHMRQQTSAGLLLPSPCCWCRLCCCCPHLYLPSEDQIQDLLSLHTCPHRLPLSQDHLFLFLLIPTQGQVQSSPIFAPSLKLSSSSSSCASSSLPSACLPFAAYCDSRSAVCCPADLCRRAAPWLLPVWLLLG